VSCLVDDYIFVLKIDGNLLKFGERSVMNWLEEPDTVKAEFAMPTLVL
jgi:hypothetical protein